MRAAILCLLLLVTPNTFGQEPKDAVAYVNRGVELGKKGECDNAIADFNEAIRLNPSYARAYGFRGNCWHDKGEYDKAIADFNEAIRLNPRYVQAYYNRGVTWTLKFECDNAIADFDEAIRLNPMYAQAYSNRGLLWHHIKGDHDKAIADYTEAIRLSSDAGPHGNRGLAWRAIGEFDKAIADFNEAIRLAPEDATAYSNLALLLATCPLEATRDGPKAIEYATRACELNGWKDCEFFNSLAAAYAETGDFDEAVKWQNQAMSICPENRKDRFRAILELYKSGRPDRQEVRAESTFRQNAAKRYYRGIELAKRGEHDKAIVEFSEFIQLYPRNIKVYHCRGLTWAFKGEHDKAIADYTEAIRLNPEYAEAYHCRGLTWASKGEHDKAIADHTEAIRLNPRYTAAYCNLAFLLAACPLEAFRDGKKAVEYATKACELNEWKDCESFNSLAAACAEAGDFKQAVKWQNKAIELSPERKRADYESRLGLYESGKPYRVEPEGEA